MYRRRRVLAWVGLASSVVAGCLDRAPGEDDDDDGDEAEDDPPARVVESELVREDAGTEEERVYVVGVVERTRAVEITYLEVRVQFKSSDGEVLDSTVEHLSDVTEGDRWEFSVEYPGIGEQAARVTDHSASVVENP